MPKNPPWLLATFFSIPTARQAVERFRPEGQQPKQMMPAMILVSKTNTLFGLGLALGLLGYFILDSMERREYPAMYAGIIGLALLGLLLYNRPNQGIRPIASPKGTASAVANRILLRMRKALIQKWRPISS